MNLTEMIKAVQKARGVTPDGFAGPATWTAIYEHEVGTVMGAIAVGPNFSSLTGGGIVDSRSEKNIATLLPHVRPYARALITEAASVGITIKIISGTRTYAEQNDLYAKGRTAPGPKVTNARGGFSNHNWGIAFDIGVFRGGKYLDDGPEYDQVGAVGKRIGLGWGGDWRGLVDKPHYELKPEWAKDMTSSQMLAEFRRRGDAQ